MIDKDLTFELKDRPDLVQDEVDNQPNWEMFNELMLQDVDFITVCSQANSLNPLLIPALTSALTQVTTNGLGIFPTLFNTVCQLGGATENQRQVWEQYAITAILPPEFIEVIKG